LVKILLKKSLTSPQSAAELKFIPGAEICSTKDDFCFHILGYGIDVTNKQHFYTFIILAVQKPLIMLQ